MAITYRNLANLHPAKTSARLDVLEKLSDVQNRMAENSPAETQLRSSLATTINEIGLIHFHDGHDIDQARKTYEKSLKIRQQLVEDDPDSIAYAINVGGSYCNLGHLESKTENHEQALTRYEQSIAALSGALKNEPNHSTAKRFLTNARGGRATLLVKLERFSAAAPDWKRCMELNSGRTARHFQNQFAFALAKAGDHHSAAGQAGRLSKSAEKQGGSLYDLACLWALCSAAVDQDSSLAAAQRKDDSEKYAVEALANLKQAHAAGYFETTQRREHLKADSDLHSLAKRSDFNEFMKEIRQTP